MICKNLRDDVAEHELKIVGSLASERRREILDMGDRLEETPDIRAKRGELTWAVNKGG
jgi:hypothetical protein